MLKVHQLSHTLPTPSGPLTLLHPLSFQLNEGESLAITGASGSGKSTLLGLLAGLDTPSAGRIELAGQDITAMDEEGRARVRAQWVGFVFQSFQLLPGLTALENVMLPMDIRGQKNAKSQAQQFLHQVGLAQRAQHYPPQLSGGEQQRVAIARAFACQPRILFADEPTGNLDTHTGESIIHLLFELNRQQATTLVLVTHEHRLAQACQHRMVLDAGRWVDAP